MDQGDSQALYVFLLDAVRRGWQPAGRFRQAMQLHAAGTKWITNRMSVGTMLRQAVLDVINKGY